MTIYTAYFRTDTDFASHAIEADTPQRALIDARILYDDGTLNLCFESHDYCVAVNEIEIRDNEENRIALWRDDELRLRLAARVLFDALEKAIAALNQAPRFAVPALGTDSYAIAAICDEAIAEAKGGAG